MYKGIHIMDICIYSSYIKIYVYIYKGINIMDICIQKGYIRDI